MTLFSQAASVQFDFLKINVLYIRLHSAVCFYSSVDCEGLKAIVFQWQKSDQEMQSYCYRNSYQSYSTTCNPTSCTNW